MPLKHLIGRLQAVTEYFKGNLREFKQMKTKVVIFNAPAGLGKDYVCEHLDKAYGFNHTSFKDRLIEIVKSFYGLTDEEVEQFSSREQKELPQEKLCGMSWRQALIHMSEVVVKPNFGKCFFGKKLANKVRIGHVNVVSDGGFYEEIEEIVKAFGKERVVIVQIHSEGYTFEGDSREYLDGTRCGVRTYKVENNFDEEFFKDVEKVLMVENILSTENV